MNKEKEFEWTDELVSELLWSRFPFPEGVIEVKPILEGFKKLKEKVKPFVVLMEDNQNDKFCVHINERKPMEIGKSQSLLSFYISKERLAEILIAEQEGKLNIIEPISSEDVKEYTGKEYLQFGEDCWNGARFNTGWCYKYKTLSEYLNDKQKPK